MILYIGYWLAGKFNTEFRTANGICIFIPNASIGDTAITNFSRNDSRRVDIVVSISYDDDIDNATGVPKGLIDEDNRVLSDPGPETMVVEFGDSSVHINMRC